jgi:hypothetical protein
VVENVDPKKSPPLAILPITPKDLESKIIDSRLG